MGKKKYLHQRHSEGNDTVIAPRSQQRENDRFEANSMKRADEERNVHRVHEHHRPADDAEVEQRLELHLKLRIAM